MARIILSEGITEDGKETVSGGMMARILIRETLTIREEKKRTPENSTRSGVGIMKKDIKMGGQHHKDCVCPVCQNMDGKHHSHCICPHCRKTGGDHHGFCLCPRCGNKGGGHYYYCICPICKKVG